MTTDRDSECGCEWCQFLSEHLTVYVSPTRLAPTWLRENGAIVWTPVPVEGDDK